MTNRTYAPFDEEPAAAHARFPFDRLESMLTYLKMAVRSVVADRSASLVAAGTLALGIAACVTMFSIADATLLRPLPYPRPERLVVLSDQMRKINVLDMAVAPAHYRDYAQHFEEAGAFAPHEFTLNLGSYSVRVAAARISSEILPLLGVQPLLGRNVRPEECAPGRDRVVLLSHAAWVERFGSRADAVGQSVRLDGLPHEIAGVLPAGFTFRFMHGPKPEFYAPVVFDFDPAPKPPRFRVLARMKPDVTVEQARAQMQSVAQRLQPAHQLYGGQRGQMMGYGIAVVPLRDRLFGAIEQPTRILCWAVALVLVIACVNVSNLLMVRAQRRAREFAVRQALGASWRSIVAPVVFESLLLAGAGAVVGTGVAYWCVRLLVYAGPLELADVTMHWRAVVFAAVVACIAAVLSAVLPAMRASRVDIAAQIAGSRTSTAGPTRRRTLNVLVAVEVALTLVLLTGSALLLRSFVTLRSTDVGFERDRMVTGSVALPAGRYKDPSAFWNKLFERLRRSSEVEVATYSTGLPLMMPAGGAPFVVEGRPFDGASAVHSMAIDPEFLKAFGIPLIAGRTFDERDTIGSPRVALINETLARGFFGSDDPIGKRVLVGGPRPNAPWLTVVGIVRDARLTSPAQKPLPQIYSATAQWPSPFAFVTVRARTEGGAAMLARAVASVDSDVAVNDVRSMDERFAASTSRPRFQAGTLGLFAVLALLLSMAGIAGVVAYGVTQRVKEIGVRLAIGATPGDVVRQVVREGMAPVIVGVIAGFTISMYVSEVLGSLLFETKPLDPLAYGAATAAFVFVALVACAAAARGAAGVDPVVALRVE